MTRKAIVWIFQATSKQNLTWEDLDMVKNENLKWKTEFLLTAAQNNATRTNFVKAKILKTQKIANIG